MEVLIRSAKAEDYREIMVLYGEFVDNANRYSNFDADSFLRVIEDEKAFIDVAVIGEKIVGFISYSIRNVVRYPSAILEVEEFYVKPDQRRKGIGRKLMDHVLKVADKKNCSYVFLASAKERPEAHEFYKATGYNNYAYHFRRKPKL